MAVKTIQVVSNALAVLDAVSRSQPAGLGALARDLGLDKSAVQRILATLHAGGWIQPAGGGGWILTGRALEVGGRYVAASDLRERAREALRELHAATGETVWLSVADGDTLVVTDEITSTHVLRVTFPIGYSGPFGPETAGGLALLAALPPDEADARIAAWAAAQVAPVWTEEIVPAPAGPVDERDAGGRAGPRGRAAQWERALTETRRTGYAVQAKPDVPLSAAAAAIPTEAGGPPMVVIIGVPRHRCAEDRLREFGELLVRTIRITFPDTRSY